MQAPNRSQLQAIQTLDGPVLIVAGPGSGKTFCLVERTVNLLERREVSPERILVSTFTEKAAKELKTRISARVQRAGSKVNPLDLTVGTLHSIFLDILDEFRAFSRIRRNYTILDQFDQQYFVYQRLSEFADIDGLDALIRPSTNVPAWYVAESLCSYLNKVAEEAVEPTALASAGHPELIAIGEAYRRYQGLLEQFNYIDFSTIQVEVLRLLDVPDVAEKLCARFDYLMIDEYQDTNTIQERIVLKLAAQHSNVCVVGDDDQALYRFRGASIRNILEFPKRFAPGQCTQINLTKNYRSHPDIVEFYNNWMALTDWEGEDRTYRYPKTIEAESPDRAERPVVFKVSGEDGVDNWANEAVAFLQELRTKNIIKDWNQVAFLFRSVRNDKVVRFANDLEASGIPVYAPRSNMYFEREEIRLLVGAYMFLFPQYGSIRATREGMQLNVWGYYDRCLSDFIAHLKSGADDQIMAWTRETAKGHLTLSENTNYSFASLFYTLIQFSTFSRYLDAEVAHGDVRDSRPARNLAKFSRLLNKYEYLYNVIVLRPDRLERDLTTLFNLFMRFLWDGGIEEYEDESDYAPSGCVSFMTIHQSKGLEFPIVICGSLDAVPRRQHSVLDDLLEDEFGDGDPFEPLDRIKTFDFWRLFYTAFSRAQNMLVLTCQENVPKGRGQRNVPSAYFRPVYSPLLNWRDLTFERSQVELAEVKPSNLKNSYSFTSDVLVFEGCPQQYRFFKDLEFAPVRTNAILFGTLVHQTIEDIHKAVLRGEEGVVTTEQIDRWFNTNYTNISQKERVYLVDYVLRVAREHVARYVDRERANWHRLREAEVELSLLKDDYVLTGNVDLIQAEDGAWEIIDFKTEKKPDMIADADKLARYRRQLQIYAHLFEEKRGVRVDRMALYYTGEESGNPRIVFPRETADIKGTIDQIDRVVGRIVTKDYELKERPEKLCKNCDFRSFCDMTFCSV
ncbi:ATP-dependent helicase [Hyphomonas sp. WL0036]|uniref:ATP-dependent helicase n=1 Tax=Hyphomonas sediminis TaxID=2866160 RepID=UPI001C809E76|nr:ATP-dependent DNA helicase [Hyphomonas sediminis]MBY9068240.1 ATP-dependent helicase [Hyphomonas sediminis]